MGTLVLSHFLGREPPSGSIGYHSHSFRDFCSSFYIIVLCFDKRWRQLIDSNSHIVVGLLNRRCAAHAENVAVGRRWIEEADDFEVGRRPLGLQMRVDDGVILDAVRTVPSARF